MFYNTGVALQRINTRLKRLVKRQRKEQKEKIISAIKKKISSASTVQQQFVHMLLKNSEVLPQVYIQ